jgi:hypothetical protein
MGRGLIWLLLPLATIAVLAAACAGEPSSRRSGVLGAGQAHGSWASPPELRWLRRLGVWNARLTKGLAATGDVERDPEQVRLLVAGDAAVTSRTQQALAPATSCRADLRAQVGTAPSARLAAAADAFERACAHLERIESLTMLAVRSQDTAVLARANAEVERGTALLADAAGLVPPGERRSLPVVGGRSTASRVEPALSRLETQLAGKEVEVRCWSREDWGRLLLEERAVSGGSIDHLTIGFANIRGHRANLSPDICANLVQLVYQRARPYDAGSRLALAASVVTLAHEAQHLRGIVAEPVAECYGMQLASRTAVAIGVEKSYADKLAEAYWRHYPDTLSEYRSPECRNGGALDLQPSASTWP